MPPDDEVGVVQRLREISFFLVEGPGTIKWCLQPVDRSEFARFNSYYRGPSVSFQTASRWLNGKSIPEQDKLVLLAELFKVKPQTLRFGEKGRLEVREPRVLWPDRVNLRDQSLFEEFLALPTKQRELVRSLVETLSEGVRKQKSD